jgi:hypothetical protein
VLAIALRSIDRSWIARIATPYATINGGGAILADYLVAYDFKDGASRQWEEFVKCAEVEGLLYVFHGTSKLFRLTNTTLWGVFSDSDAATAAFDKALSAAKWLSVVRSSSKSGLLQRIRGL